MTSDYDELQTQLTKSYHQLVFPEKTIVQLFSVIYEPVNRISFLTCFNSVCQYLGHPTLTYENFEPYLDSLLAANLLIQNQSLEPQCHPLLAEIATRDAIQERVWGKMVAVTNAHMPLDNYYFSDEKWFKTKQQLLREVRIGIYRRDPDYVVKQVKDYERQRSRSDNGLESVTLDEVVGEVVNNPFDGKWFLTLPHRLYEGCLTKTLTDSQSYLRDNYGQFTMLLQESTKSEERCSDYLRLILAEQLILRDNIEAAKFVIRPIRSKYQDNAEVFRGWLAFREGNYQSAIAHFKTGFKAHKRAMGRRQLFFQNIAGIFFILALSHEGSPASLKQAEECATIVASESDHRLSHLYLWLKNFLQMQQGYNRSEWVANAKVYPYQETHSIDTLISSLCLYWLDPQQAEEHLPSILTPLYEDADAAGYHWLARETAQLLSRVQGNNDSSTTKAKVAPLVDLFTPKQPWELSLQALANFQQQAPTKKAAVGEKPGKKRLVWLITYDSYQCILQPKEQKMTTKGGWSKGRPIGLKRLSSEPEKLDYLTPQDLRVCNYIDTYSQSSRGSVDYNFAPQGILALVGHPLVFWEDSPATRVDIVKGEPELIVRKTENSKLVLEFQPQLPENKKIIILKETPTRIKAIEITPEHQHIAGILGKKNRLEVPMAASEQVLAAIHGVSSLITVQSDIGGGLESAQEITANAQPHLHLIPAGAGLKVSLLCRPFGDVGSYYPPGKGGTTVIADIGGKRWQTTRDLDLEQDLADNVTNACTILHRYPENNGEWLVTHPQDCLELLVELQDLGDQVIVEWPEGEKIQVNYQADIHDLRVQVKRNKDWFTATGELPLDDELVLDMQRLIVLLDETPGRFVPLGDGQFLALTESFRQRLEELRMFTEILSQGLRFHPLASLAMGDLFDGVGELETDNHWQEHVGKLKEMENFQPQLPSTLQAELRDYQLEGFTWLAKLAHWGVGACLADDMGLGKTLQALAVILTKAHQGATLVIAPTSVCMNWISEAEKFAPTLNTLQLGSGDRQQVLDNLQPFDMLVCSYGLLQQPEVGEMLAKVQWQTIVLDEAQAIKNTATKRSRAAMELQGEFKLITTGTPIENHLGELWNLFRFINPGLLGSWEKFNQRFANPIDKYDDKQASSRLKKLIQPFLLRRTKTQVLPELPSRTEILLHVEMSPEETAFYEAVRREAITKISESKAQAGTKHLQVLAEIMKLRRACCNPSLVMAGTDVMSSKLELFGEVLAELLENRHKALVFSQFVDHLHIIQDYLESRNISYQYLDGSTPTKQRKQRVDAFQGGEGDVFLISLKAGGTGLNLTAADYVIHMDPWWNPAVEDQASDRAHRIGQKRPVTIYRLVTKGTIEEKILELHGQKRDLADSLLEGTDVSGKISTEDLLQLISSGF